MSTLKKSGDTNSRTKIYGYSYSFIVNLGINSSISMYNDQQENTFK